jgi:hypothetical protein
MTLSARRRGDQLNPSIGHLRCCGCQSTVDNVLAFSKAFLVCVISSLSTLTPSERALQVCASMRDEWLIYHLVFAGVVLLVDAVANCIILCSCARSQAMYTSCGAGERDL